MIGEAYGCDFDTAGNLYISDGRNHTIRLIDNETGIITTVAWPCGLFWRWRAGGPATEVGLERPHGCGIDPQGNLYIANGVNHRVRVVGMRGGS